MFMEALFVVLVSGVLYFFAMHRWSRVGNFPPGPRPLPVIGNLLEMKKFNHVTMAAWAKQYGRIYMLTVLGKKVFIVTDIELAREALLRQGSVFAGRPTSYVMSCWYEFQPGLAFEDYGATWKLLRKLSHSALRMFGSGIENLENKVYREVDELCFQLDQTQGVPLDLRKLISIAVSNVIFSCLFSCRYAKDDKHFKECTDLVDGIMHLAGAADLLETFPIMKFLPGEIHSRIKNTTFLKKKLLTSKLQERKETYKEGVIRDITDALIKALHDVHKEDSKTKGILNEQCLKNAIGDLFVAGSDTTAVFLTWSFLYLAAFPEVQARIQQELDDVIGPDCKIRFKDKSSLPYFEATIAEIMRHGSFNYFSLPRKVRGDTTLGNYDIPEDSQVIVDIRSIHHNPKHWRDPDSFDPTRFLHPEDNSFICPASFSFLPFGGGLRGCLGQTLARIEIFLFLGQVLQQFNLSLPPGSSKADLEAPVEPIIRAILAPKPFQLCVTKRVQ